MVQISSNLYPSKINGGVKKITQHAPIGQCRFESWSHEKRKHDLWLNLTNSTQLWLNFTCTWQRKTWQLLCTLLIHVFMVLYAINWKIQSFPEILWPFYSFKKNFPRLTLVSPLRCDDKRRDTGLLRLYINHINQTMCNSSSLVQCLFSSWYMKRN